MCADDYTTPIVLWAPALPDFVCPSLATRDSQKYVLRVVDKRTHTCIRTVTAPVVWRRRAGDDANGRDETA